MENLRIPLFFFLTFILFSCSISSLSSISQLQTAQNQCLDDQRSALVELQHGLYHSQNFNFSSKAELWDLNLDCCSWKGVMCDDLGHVTGLDLNNKSLSGRIHPIFNLHHLRKLNIARNNFNTRLFQFRLDRLPNLTHLNLSASCFHGQVPIEISYLKRLVSLDLSSEDMCYKRNDRTYVPHNLFPLRYFPSLRYYPILEDFPTLKLENPNFETFIKNMKSVRELYLDGVNISSQSSKWCETISLALPKLSVLSLSSCRLSGPFCSSLSRLHFLSKLNLNHNPISYLPHNFLEITARLVSLSLVDCNLSGFFPTQVFLLPKILRIEISENYDLSGQLPEFPSNNSTLQVLSIECTNFGGKLPESIGNLMSLTNLRLCVCHFFGKIPSSIANLTNLVELDLTYNQLYGSLHSTLFTLPSLKFLSVGGNKFVGEIPEFPNASSSSIQALRLRYNHLGGSIPESILQLLRVETLSLGYNSFGPMKLDMFSQMKRLWFLDLSNISLSIESVNNKSLSFPELEILGLSSCNLTEFPEFIKTQEKLFLLDLSNNHIHGLVPTWLWKSSLLRLQLSVNAIDFPKELPFNDADYQFPMLRRLDIQACNLSLFPEFLMSQENLEYLDISNNQVSGLVPNWMWHKSLRILNLSHNHLSYLDQSLPNQSLTYSQGSSRRSICNLSRLMAFSASYNNLSGPIPNCLGNISTLYWLDLQGNNFTGNLPNLAEALEIVQVSGNRLEGKLPRSLANCTQLGILDVGNNTMYDRFPFWLGKLPALKVLVLRENRFYGQIKHYENVFPALDVLDIASNNFSGALSLDFLQTTQLRSLKIGGNKLEGKLPRSLASCRRLEVLDLGNNMVHDTFPYWMEKLPSLMVLILRANRFYGTINNFESIENVFPMLRIVDIASNNFSGELPVQFFQCLKAMMQITDGNKAELHYIGEQYYQDSVTIVNKGIELSYQKILTILACLDVSNNSFHGIIPKEINYLKLIKVLNFSHNSFFGPIPLLLENLTELESLDLSENNLSVKIPLQLTTLTFLAVLNLSYNQLEGIIPQSNQFSTFSNDSYQGNPRLCGPPLTRKCNEVGIPLMPPTREDVDSWADGISVWKIALMGYGSGLVIGFCVGCTVLNEWGNKWLDHFGRKVKRTRRRSR